MCLEAGSAAVNNMSAKSTAVNSLGGEIFSWFTTSGADCKAGKRILRDNYSCMFNGFVTGRNLAGDVFPAMEML